MVNCEDCKNIIEINESVCRNCGLIKKELEQVYDDYIFEKQNENERKSFKVSNFSKMQLWNNYSKDERKIYNLDNYTRDFCIKLEIIEQLIPHIIKTVQEVMMVINEIDGIKRSRVKNGIIIVCIYYISKNSEKKYSCKYLANKAEIETKYITRAENIILELINSKKLKWDKSIILQPSSPYDYINDCIVINNLKINKELLTQTKKLIDICSDKDILSNNAPASIGVCCFYYILKRNNIDINIKLFSNIYNISFITITKTLKQLEENSILAL